MTRSTPHCILPILAAGPRANAWRQGRKFSGQVFGRYRSGTHHYARVRRAARGGAVRVLAVAWAFPRGVCAGQQRRVPAAAARRYAEGWATSPFDKNIVHHRSVPPAEGR
jgi:hypothetical protein